MATWIVHEAAAERHREKIMVEPGAVIEHHAEEVRLVGAARAAHSTAVLAAHIPRERQCHFRNSADLRLGCLVVTPYDTAVLVDPMHVGVIHVGCSGIRGADVRRGAAAVCRVAAAGYEVVLAQEVAVEHQLDVVVGDPKHLPPVLRSIATTVVCARGACAASVSRPTACRILKRVAGFLAPVPARAGPARGRPGTQRRGSRAHWSRSAAPEDHSQGAAEKRHSSRIAIIRA